MELPYEPRPGQEALIAAIEDTQRRGRHAVLESPTGTGKTIAALIASLRTCKREGTKLIYATRTNSQQTQVVAEHHAIRKHGQDPGLLIPFMGRRHYCPLMKDDEKFRDGTAEELGRLCRDAKRKATQAHETGREVKGACRYYQKLIEDGPGPVEAYLRAGLNAQVLGQRISTCGSCPYEALKMLLPQADAVVVPTVFVIDDRLRATLMSWLGVGPDATHVVLDEAHNLPGAAQEHHSPRMGAATLQRAAHEAEGLQDPVLAGKVLTSSFLHAVTATILGLADEFVLEDADDGLVPTGALEERLMERLRIPSTTIMQAAKDLETWGDIVREDRRSKGRLPRSYLGAVAEFLRAWWGSSEAPYAHLVERDPLAVEAYLLHPGAVLGWIHECASTIHMSGTLAPGEDHVALCELPADTVVKHFATPFTAQQLQVAGLHGVHRRWQAHQENPAHAEDQQRMAKEALSKMPGRTALWFPSYAMMRNYLEEGFLHDSPRRIFQETAEMDLKEAIRLVERFKITPGALLLGVLGGRLSEGIDFPGDAMESALVFGIPYPRPTARLQALIHHQDRVHDGQGWTYAVHNPVGRRIRQAIGRLVRGPDDEGTAIILDERIARFRQHLPTLRMCHNISEAMAGIPQDDGFHLAALHHQDCESQSY